MDRVLLTGPAQSGWLVGDHPCSAFQEAILRITHVVGTDGFAGLEHYVVEVSNELSRRGHDVSVVGGAADSMLRTLDESVSWSPGSNTAELLRSLSRGGRRHIVHSHITKSDYTALITAPLTGGRRISTRHITVARGHSRVAQMLAPVVRRALAVEIAVSRYVAESVRPPSDEILVNGVREQRDVETPRDKVVLMAHRLAPEKDTPTGLRAWALSGLAERGWRLIVAGEGSDRKGLEMLARELAIEATTDFVGWLSEPSIAFRTAAILLAPAPAEPCGLSILEAMALGLPVVAADAGGHPETVGLVDGAALFPAGDAHAAAEHLRRLADDENAREAYGRRLRETQRERLTLGAHVDGLEAVYAAAMSSNHRRAGAPVRQQTPAKAP